VTRIRVERVAPETPDQPGMVWYELLYDDGSDGHSVQPFSRTAGRTFPNWNLIWLAEGPDDALTLSPSFLSRWTRQLNFGDRHEVLEVVVHLFLRAGKVELCGDSTVVLA
jgi:hypothetical protein